MLQYYLGAHRPHGPGGNGEAACSEAWVYSGIKITV